MHREWEKSFDLRHDTHTASSTGLSQGLGIPLAPTPQGKLAAGPRKPLLAARKIQSPAQGGKDKHDRKLLATIHAYSSGTHSYLLVPILASNRHGGRLSDN